MIIMGIDPGTAITGYGIITYSGNKFKVIDYGCIRTSSKLFLDKRLCQIYNDIKGILDQYPPDAYAVEQLFFNKNTRTALAVGQARGVLVLAAADRGIPVFEYTPLQVKQSVAGYGRAEKSQIQQMVKTFLNLRTIPKPDDVADALAIAICHAHSYRLLEKTVLKGEKK
ncbi:crossover junction endodeoxyribonuclease RuvC [Metallumcola ferriviriculae]|uniref:Crossover junction endodeoxyribonuclease RuvC n=1 Tax=Metallumcola ferriviriculae TaxID=3039180 RepID=A0AAU0USF6_9FIRM|nr:crossover junction endodeoxyribonuclease RuvC [Desulfitibacteraceae bacterium MK1]